MGGAKPGLTAERLRGVLHYDPETGVFTRLVDTGGRGGRIGVVVGTRKNNGSIKIGVCGGQFPAGRVAWLLMTGGWPKQQVCHKNGDRSDLRWENLIDGPPTLTRVRRSSEREAMLRGSSRGAENVVTIELLRQRVHYDPDTGELRWAEQVPPECFIDARGSTIWHGKFAGKPIAKRQHGYVIVSVSVHLRTYYLQGHRVAWALMTGAWPTQHIDHRNRVRDDNRWTNLREATHHQNQWNRGITVRNKTGHKGVFQNARGKYIAQIRDGAKTRHLGTFATAEAAAAVRQEQEKRLYGEFAPHLSGEMA